MNAATQLQRPAGTVEAERAATVYAEALLNVASQEGQTDAVLRDLSALVQDVVQKEPAIAEFFLSAIVGRDRKEAVLQKAFGPDRVNPILSRFLLVLNEHDRLYLLGPILVVAERLHLRRENKFLVDVVSAVPLTEAEQERLKGLLHHITDAEPITTFRVDPDLLGGLVVRTGSYLFDGSLRGRLQALRETLFEKQP